MKRIILGTITVMGVALLVACGEDKAIQEKQMNSLLQEETVEEESKGDWDEETSKVISHTNTNMAKGVNGETVTVKESFYAGESLVSKYEINYVTDYYREVNLSFEGPKGMCKNLSIDEGNIVMSTGNDELRFVINDYILYGDMITGEESEYDKALEVMQTDESFWNDMKNVSEDDWIKFFVMQEASSYAEIYDEYLLVMDEAPFAPEAKLAGYAGVKWYYKDPLFVMCFYAEQVNEYDDTVALTIYDTLQWDFVE